MLHEPGGVIKRSVIQRYIHADDLGAVQAAPDFSVKWKRTHRVVRVVVLTEVLFGARKDVPKSKMRELLNAVLSLLPVRPNEYDLLPGTFSCKR